MSENTEIELEQTELAEYENMTLVLGLDVLTA